MKTFGFSLMEKGKDEDEQVEVGVSMQGVFT